MKYIVLIGVVLVVLWILRSKSSTRNDDSTGAQQARVAPPQDMVSCPVCSVHLPRTDALPGPGGKMYCCAEHRQRAGA